MGIYLRVLSKSYTMDTNMTGLKVMPINQTSLGLNVLWRKEASVLERLTILAFYFSLEP